MRTKRWQTKVTDGAGSAALPPLGYLDLDKITKEGSAYTHNPSTFSMHAPPLVSPSTTYSGPPPPYSYPSSAASSVVGGNNGSSGGQVPATYNPPQNRQAAGADNKDTSYSTPRQSLPSINEALSISSILNTSAPPRPSNTARSPTSPTYQHHIGTPSNRPATSAHQQPSREANTYENMNRTSAPTISSYTNYAHDTKISPTTNSFPNTLPASQPSRTMQSPTSYPRPGPSIIQHRHPLSPYSANNHTHANNGTTYQPSSRPEPITNGLSSHHTYQPAYSYPPSTPAVTSYQSPLVEHSTWRGGNPDLERAEEVRKATSKESPPGKPVYGEYVKRHLDIFDLETSLNEVRCSIRLKSAKLTPFQQIAEGSGRALEFSRHYGIAAHHTQRSGPIPGSLPSINECDDMIRQQNRVLECVSSIREVILKQQQALAEQKSYDERNHKNATSQSEGETGSYLDKIEGSGGFAGPDPKKRRGRAAPPGRCHSCNRAETPEWRRGPDGARTLCNACGLRTYLLFIFFFFFGANI